MNNSQITLHFPVKDPKIKDNGLSHHSVSHCAGHLGLTDKGYKRTLGSDKSVLDIDCGEVYILYTFIKTHQITHLKWEHFIVSKFTSIKIDKAQGLNLGDSP